MGVVVSFVNSPETTAYYPCAFRLKTHQRESRWQHYHQIFLVYRISHPSLFSLHSPTANNFSLMLLALSLSLCKAIRCTIHTVALTCYDKIEFEYYSYIYPYES